MASRPRSTKRKPDVVLRRFGPTGKPVPVSRRANDLAKREGYGMFEDGTLKLPPIPASIRGQLDNRQGEAARAQTKRRDAAGASTIFNPAAVLDKSQVRDLRGTPTNKGVKPRPGPAYPAPPRKRR